MLMFAPDYGEWTRSMHHQVRLNRTSPELATDEPIRETARLVDTFQRIIDGLPDQIALVNESWEILAVNPAWMTTSLLYTSDELMPGSNYLEFCRLKSAEGYKEAAIAMEGAEKIASGEQDAFSFVYEGVDRWEGITFQTCIRR